jgi:PTS system nitrogen regulatory IIA component
MEINEFLKPENVILDFAASSKKQTIEALSTHLIAQTKLDHHDLLTALYERERLGSTGVGSGVAIPHARLKNIENISGLFASLEKPIAFKSVDDKPVDLVFMLLLPEDGGAENLKALAKVSKFLRQETVREKLRQADDIPSVLKTFQAR